MLKSSLVASFVLAVASPLAVAGDKPMADKVATAATTTTTAQAAMAAPAAATGKSMVAGTSSTAAQGARAAPAVRDWSAIDTQRDNLITPEEMEKFLQETWAANKKSG